jgi:hypothetical protein
LLPLPIPSPHPFLFPFTYLETLLGVIGSRPPWSQVTRELTSPFSTPPHPSPLQIPSIPPQISKQLISIWIFVCKIFLILPGPDPQHFLPIHINIPHKRASTSAFMSAISDIDISYFDIRTKYVGLSPFIPLSEEFQYRHQLPFRYETRSLLDIPISKIDKSFPSHPSKIP